MAVEAMPAREFAGQNFDEGEFWRIDDETCQSQSGLQRALRTGWLYPDVKPTPEVLSEHYKPGIASNNNLSGTRCAATGFSTPSP